MPESSQTLTTVCVCVYMSASMLIFHRYTPTTDSQVVVDIKKRLLSALGMISGVTLDFRVANILHIVNSTSEDLLFCHLKDREDISEGLGMSMRHKLSTLKCALNDCFFINRNLCPPVCRLCSAPFLICSNES
jgi:hypothetical protein